MEDGLEGVLEVEKAAPVVNRASGGEITRSRQHKGEQESAAVVGFAVVRVVPVGFTCPAMAVATVGFRALDRVRERALGLLCARSPKSTPARRKMLPSPGNAQIM